MTAPKRIWLQDAGDYRHAAQFEVTWCAEPQDDADTEYIRADLVPTLEHALALPEIKALVDALNACAASLERADTEEGVCCCGDDMASHGDPINCGHIPVDMGNYYAGKALDAARAALRAIGEAPDDLP